MHVPYLRLRAKLTLGVVTVLAPLLALQLHTFQRERERRLDHVSRDLQQSAQMGAEMVMRKLDSGLNLAHTIALTTDARTMRAEVAEPLLRAVAAPRDEVARIALFDLDGYVRVPAGDAEVPTWIGDRPYFSEALATLGPVISGVLVDRQLDVPVIVAAAPITGPDGAPVGVAKVALRIGWLVERFGVVELAPGQALFVIDAEGKLAMHTDGLDSWTGYDMTGIPVIRGAYRDGIAYSDAYVSPITGDRRMVSVIRIPEHGWLVGISWSLEEAFAPVEEAHGRALAVFAVIACISLLGAFVVSGLFAAPIRQLGDHARALGSGEAHRRARIRTGDEIEELGQAFDAMADRLEEEKRRRRVFISAISHEMRNMLMPLGLAAQQSVRRVARGEAVDEGHLRIVVNQTGRLDRLVRDLSELSHLEVGRFELVRTPSDLVGIARAVVADLMSSYRREIELDAPEHLAIEVDHDRVAQVLTNLVSNAMKYSPEGGRVRVGIRDQGDDAVVSVTDEGLGLDPDQVERLFAPYTRLHLDHGIQGLGMGLFVCRAIVEAHGGRIWADSEGAGRGTRFSFTLPRRPPPTS